MRTADCTLLMVPDTARTDAEHWQRRWAAKLPTARWVAWAPGTPDRAQSLAALSAAIADAEPPILLIAHGLGVALVAHAAPAWARERVAGAFLVAPRGEAGAGADRDGAALLPYPRAALGCPAVLVVSRTDPLCPLEEAVHWARLWGAEVSDAGDVGGITPQSGHGPWPEGLMRFAGFMNSLRSAWPRSMPSPGVSPTT